MSDETPEPLEEWRDVVGFESYYTVSNRGRVRSSRTGRIRKLTPTVNCYEGIWLCNQGKSTYFLVHWLVAAAFIGPRPSGWVIDHRDNVPWNNQVGNLKYVTRSENAMRAGEIPRAYRRKI